MVVLTYSMEGVPETYKIKHQPIDLMRTVEVLTPRRLKCPIFNCAVPVAEEGIVTVKFSYARVPEGSEWN